MDGCIGVFEVVKFHTKRHRAEKVRLTFEIETEAGFHLTETPLSRDQHVKYLDNEWLEITATVVDSAMLDWWIRGFGEAIRAVKKTILDA